MLDRLKEFGVDVDKVLFTLNGKTDLFEKLILHFYQMVKDSNITPEVRDGLYEDVHALKGASGNLGITPLFDQYVVILDFLREENFDKVPAAVEELLPLQKKFMECVEEFM